MLALRDITLKTKLIIYSISLVIFTALIISIASYKATENVIKIQVGQQIRISTRQVMIRTDEFLQNIHKMALTVAFDTRLKKLLAKNELESYEDMQNIFDYSGYIDTFNYLNMNINSLYIYSLKNMFYISSKVTRNYITKEDENYKLIIKNFAQINKSGSKNYYVWVGNRKRKWGGNEESYISLIVPVRDNDNTLIGALVMNIKEKIMASIYEDDDIKSTGDFFIEDSKGIIVSSTQKDRIGYKSLLAGKYPANGSNSLIDKINGEDYLITEYNSPYNKWRFVAVTSFNEMMKGNIRSLRNIILLIVLVTILMLVVMSYFMNQAFYKPVNSFIEQLKTLVRNRMEIEKIERNDEIGFIFNNFCEILKENNRLMNEVHDEKVNSKVYEFKALQAQINPHFLYNSLDGAICMMKLNKRSKAEEMIISLIKLYRLSLDDNKKIVTVKEEVENLECYISIQKARYGEKLKVDIDIAENIMDYKMLKLLLQPLVENSIYHGVGKKKGMGSIWISGSKDMDLIKFVIKDNGKGISEEELCRIREIINCKQPPNDKFYALQNVNSRIKLYYGDCFGISIESRENEWAQVTIALPTVE